MSGSSVDEVDRHVLRKYEITQKVSRHAGRILFFPGELTRTLSLSRALLSTTITARQGRVRRRLQGGRQEDQGDGRAQEDL